MKIEVFIGSIKLIKMYSSSDTFILPTIKYKTLSFKREDLFTSFLFTYGLNKIYYTLVKQNYKLIYTTKVWLNSYFRSFL